MNWSKILTDPENILKQARERKITEESEDFCGMDIEALNPTYAMLNVYNKAIGRVENSRSRSDRYVSIKQFHCDKLVLFTFLSNKNITFFLCYSFLNNILY